MSWGGTSPAINMIVQPDFCEHWKSRLLVEITGDESSLIAVLRLWSHCQHSRRSEFPEMTPAQLASVCHWGDRKPACHVALVKAGFVEKLTPKGFAAHQWSQHNAQLLQKWQAGQKGGRPPTSEKANEKADSEKPTDNRPLTGTKPDRPDQTRPEEIDKIRPDQTDQTPASSCASSAMAELRASPDAPKDGVDSKSLSGLGGLDGLVGGIASKMTTKANTVPTLSQVQHFLMLQFEGAAQYAEPFYKTMQEQKWCDKNGEPISNWQAMAKSYASNAWRNRNANRKPRL